MSGCQTAFADGLILRGRVTRVKRWFGSWVRNGSVIGL